MIDQQLYNYMLISQNWHKTEPVVIIRTPETTTRRFYAPLIKQFGQWMVIAGRYLQRIGKPSYQTARQTNL